jgi:predicted Fe-S protein YdhL (DUF1289 family)
MTVQAMRSVRDGGDDAADVASPCVNVCSLDPQTGWCVGCLRTIDEIAAWGALDAAARRAIRVRLPARREALGERAEKAP